MNDRPDSNPNSDPHDGEDSGDDHDERWESQSAGGSWLSNLLHALERFEDLSRSGRRGDRTALDYDVSIRSGLSDLGRASERRGDDGSPADYRDEEPTRAPERPRTRRKRSTDTDHHVTTRTHDDELLVTADLSGVDPEDVTVGFDDGEIVVGVGKRELERTRVPWEERVAQAAVRNGILTVTVRPDTNDSGTDDGDDTYDDGNDTEGIDDE